MEAARSEQVRVSIWGEEAARQRESLRNVYLRCDLRLTVIEWSAAELGCSVTAEKAVQ
jgi:uncharacterized protein (DUF2252 family)